jgi:lysophospholipase L1-like esterase
MIASGVVSVSLGLALNPPVLASVLVRSGQLPAPVAMGILAIEVVLVALGLMLIHFRNDSQVRANVALLAGSMTISLVGAEATLRLIDFRPGELRLYREAPDGSGLFRLKPNLDIVTRIGAQRITIRTNSRGMRWREVSYASADGRKRIAFVGDSFTFGLWADRVENSFVGIVAARLEPLGVEVLNFGVPGYGLRDSEALIRDEVLRFKPDHVVVMFFNGNDFLDTYLGTERYRVSRGGWLETQWDRIEPKIPLEFRTRRPAHEFGLNRLYLYEIVKYAVKSAWPAVGEAVNRGNPGEAQAITDTSYLSDAFWSRTTYSPFAKAAKLMTLEALKDIRQLCERNGSRLIVMTIPGIEQVYIPDAGFGSGYDRSLPQKFVQEFAESHDIGYLDLLPALRRYVSEQNASLYYRNEGHFRNEGHSVVGNEIAAFLRREVVGR